MGLRVHGHDSDTDEDACCDVLVEGVTYHEHFLGLEHGNVNMKLTSAPQVATALTT